MSEPDSTPIRRRHRYQVVFVAMGLVIFLLLAACPLGALGVHQRVIPPPSFSLRIGNRELVGPCPARLPVCDETTPWYAIWWGEHRPDGGVRYKQIFFAYLRPLKRR
ncbi:MAG TPA: hypothetical protein VFX76_01820 [Roseiflexaceae bacterium]|nr:hypothetical protein [Roseiflexaceae bacterium]